jgi:hypothetical protein
MPARVLDRAAEQASQQLELAVAPDHRRAQARHPTRRLVALAREDHRADRGGLSAHIKGSRRLEGESAHRGSGAVTDEDLAGRRGLLEPGRHVDGVAGRHRLARPGRRGGEHLARVHADPQPELDAVRRLELVVQVAQPALHPKRRAQGACGVVLVCGGHAERSHDGVADELLDRPALRLDLLPHRGEEPRQHILQRLGVEPGAERRRVGHIGEGP